VVWRADQPIGGSVDAVGRLRSRGERLVFLTNNSNQTQKDCMAKLEDMGIEAGEDEVITSAMAAATMIEPGETALVCAGQGVVEALEERGVTVVREGEADAVVVGWHTEFDYNRLKAAAGAVRGGARLIGTNDDATYPTPEGPIPGGGSLLAAVAVASGATPEVAGKPHEPVARLIEERIGSIDVLVGDRPSTDGKLARRLGARFLLVLSGVTSEDDLPVEPEPDEVGENLAAHVPNGDQGDQ
jgi:HAD superfamily hydrolase (TIGR01450 family)